jgi:RNA polymerase sigma-70 factor (ECF subfamily)
LTQDTFLSAFKGHKDFRRESSTRTWIFRIARNKYKNHLRTKKTQKRAAPEVSLSTHFDGRDSDDMADELEVVDSKAPSPEDLVLAKERDETLHNSLEGVPSQMRQGLELRLEGLRYREIAEIMGISIETVKSHLHQGRQRLREILREGHDESRSKK